MPVRAEAIGMSETIVADVTARWALAYAAAIGFTGPQCLDDAASGGPTVPPQFCVCLEWAITGSNTWTAGLGATSDERRRGVHVLQDSIFHSPIRAGMRVRTTGRIAHVRNTSAGAYVLTHLEIRDERTNALLTTSLAGSILRGITVEGKPAEVPAATEQAIEPRERPDSPRAVSVAIDRGQPHVYSECAQIWNPIHTERKVALAAGLPDIIVHGTATWALAGREIVREHCSDDASRLRRLCARFSGIVIPGSAVTLEHARREGTPAIDFAVRNATGALAISHGLAEIGPATG